MRPYILQFITWQEPEVAPNERKPRERRSPLADARRDRHRTHNGRGCVARLRRKRGR